VKPVSFSRNVRALQPLCCAAIAVPQLLCSAFDPILSPVQNQHSVQGRRHRLVMLPSPACVFLQPTLHRRHTKIPQQQSTAHRLICLKVHVHQRGLNWPGYRNPRRRFTVTPPPIVLPRLDNARSMSATRMLESYFAPSCYAIHRHAANQRVKYSTANVPRYEGDYVNGDMRGYGQ
jgi:hypothetical protein